MGRSCIPGPGRVPVLRPASAFSWGRSVALGVRSAAPAAGRDAGGPLHHGADREHRPPSGRALGGIRTKCVFSWSWSPRPGCYLMERDRGAARRPPAGPGRALVRPRSELGPWPFGPLRGSWAGDLRHRLRAGMLVARSTMRKRRPLLCPGSLCWVSERSSGLFFTCLPSALPACKSSFFWSRSAPWLLSR